MEGQCDILCERILLVVSSFIKPSALTFGILRHLLRRLSTIPRDRAQYCHTHGRRTIPHGRVSSEEPRRSSLRHRRISRSSHCASAGRMGPVHQVGARFSGDKWRCFVSPSTCYGDIEYPFCPRSAEHSLNKPPCAFSFALGLNLRHQCLPRRSA